MADTGRNFSKLPPELQFEIALGLDDRSLQKLCRTNRYFAVLCRDEYFWQKKIKRDYPDSYKDLRKTWKDENYPDKFWKKTWENLRQPLTLFYYFTNVIDDEIYEYNLKFPKANDEQMDQIVEIIDETIEYFLDEIHLQDPEDCSIDYYEYHVKPKGIEVRLISSCSANDLLSKRPDLIYVLAEYLSEAIHEGVDSGGVLMTHRERDERRLILETTSVSFGKVPVRDYLMNIEDPDVLLNFCTSKRNEDWLSSNKSVYIYHCGNQYWKSLSIDFWVKKLKRDFPEEYAEMIKISYPIDFRVPRDMWYDLKTKSSRK